MTTMTPAEADAVWTAIDDQRARTADLLEQLSPEQWDHPSLCQGWTVRHVAAHLTLQQQRIRDVAAFVAHHPRLLRSVTLNASIHASAVLQAQLLPTTEITSRIRAMIGSRRHNAFVTPLETLTDILVHSQDIRRCRRRRGPACASSRAARRAVVLHRRRARHRSWRRTGSKGPWCPARSWPWGHSWGGQQRSVRARARGVGFRRTWTAL